ncbi:predicted protein [Nematostella vectensis]|uniref:Integrase core domain-containing protein n=1 Tax=Nematostella vectensis TaxID=45351 RepID=A7RQT0_NEMVE|nr:predicted protein [Nematostella vectensis]|eukprot:XP_001638223.1 predicted protein [Nematostella vectensis]
MADSESEDQERTIITQLFHLGHSYDDIVGLLSKCHWINISNFWMDQIRLLDIGQFGNLRMKGILVPRVVVQEMLKEIDPNGVELRKAHKLKRRVYRSLGPNSTWHADGYDKLKPYGFPMHACIDGFSRKVIWLYVTRSNNYPDDIASYYLDAVKQLGGCPRELDTDLGTENGAMADMIEKAVLNTADKLHLECLWFCFAELLQNDLKRVGDSWNTHYIRKSRHDTVAGRPDAIFHLPESYGGIDNLLVPVSQHDMSYAYTHLVQQDEDDEYQEYFRYVLHSLNKKKPEHWREALQMYEELLHIAVNGC